MLLRDPSYGSKRATGFAGPSVVRRAVNIHSFIQAGAGRRPWRGVGRGLGVGAPTHPYGWAPLLTQIVCVCVCPGAVGRSAVAFLGPLILIHMLGVPRYIHAWSAHSK